MAKTLEKRVEELEKIVRALQGSAAVKISKKLGVGDTFEVAGLKWTILDITEKGYACLADKYGKDIQFDTDCNNWQASDLRNHLNTTFLKEMEEVVGGDNILPFKRDLLSLDGLRLTLLIHPHRAELLESMSWFIIKAHSTKPSITNSTPITPIGNL